VTLTLRDDPNTSVVLVVSPGVIETFAGDEATGLGWYSPVYGRLERATTVRVTDRRDNGFRMAAVLSLDAANPIAEIAWIADTTLRITRKRSADEVAFAQTDVKRILQKCAVSLAS
jgi:hypothetical protein